jgi:hypothetical protein
MLQCHTIFIIDLQDQNDNRILLLHDTIRYRITLKAISIIHLVKIKLMNYTFATKLSHIVLTTLKIEKKGFYHLLN